MCGICGIVDLSKQGPPISEAELVALRDALTHRGPDDAGIAWSNGAGLGARRLKVLDLSQQAHMPMANEDESLWITFNGEIYNFEALRSELAALGHAFRSTGDTEVVLRAYVQWGDVCVERLEGMFAFAVWDARRRRLFAARDRLGVKPFFYTQRGEFLAFASEVHALYRFAAPGPDAIDPVALDAFLAFGSVPPDRAFVRGMQKLAPGHSLTFDRTGLQTRRYWDVRFRPTREIGEAECLDELQGLLGDAVEARLRSDVPLGCFLSGGIDSGLVAALAAERSTTPIQTFSVGFRGAKRDDDERPLARSVAERWGTRHTELEVDPGGRSDLVAALRHVGEPFADVGILPMLAISREARRHITVALSGDGGDESFAGYPNVRAAWVAERVRPWLPAPVARSAARWLPRGGILGKVPRFLEAYVLPPVSQQLGGPALWTAKDRLALLGPSAGVRGAQLVAAEVLASEPALRAPELHLKGDLALRLPGYLTKVDVASSLVSLEVRSPFLDRRLVEWAASLPLERKLPGGRQKGLLRDLAKRYLPSVVVSQPKRGFAPDLGAWLRGDWAPWVRELTGQSRVVAAGVLREPAVREVAASHLEGRADHSQRLWNVMALEIWWRLFISEEDPL